MVRLNITLSYIRKTILLVFFGTAITALVIANSVIAAVPYINTRVSVDSLSVQGNGASSQPSVSKDGRYVTFTSSANNLVSGDTNGVADIFLRDLLNNTTTRISLSSTGTEGNGGSTYSKISFNGRYVLFTSTASNFASNDNNGTEDIFLRDTVNATTELISISTTGSTGNYQSGGDLGLDISRDGKYVVFTSSASNLVTTDTGGKMDVFVRDRTLGTTTLISMSDSGIQGNGDSRRPSISCEGSRITFYSQASNLVTSDTNGHSDVFYVDRIGQRTMYNITQASNGYSGFPSISCSGDTISYHTDASNLLAADTNVRSDIYAHDISSDSTYLVSKSTSGTISDGYSYTPSVSADGRYITFESGANNLAGYSNGWQNIYIHDRFTATTEKISKRNSSTNTFQNSSAAKISVNGEVVVYESDDTGLVTGDTNALTDAFSSETGVTEPSL